MHPRDHLVPVLNATSINAHGRMTSFLVVICIQLSPSSSLSFSLWSWLNKLPLTFWTLSKASAAAQDQGAGDRPAAGELVSQPQELKLQSPSALIG